MYILIYSYLLYKLVHCKNFMVTLSKHYSACTLGMLYTHCTHAISLKGIGAPCNNRIVLLTNTLLCECTTQSQHCLTMWPTAQPKTAVIKFKGTIYMALQLV